MANPDCHWCAGAAYVHGDPDLACPVCYELQVMVDAFRAGAEYMRRSSRIVHDEVPAIGSAYQSGRDFVRVPRMEMPDAQRIDSAAAGYVAGLSGGAS